MSENEKPVLHLRYDPSKPIYLGSLLQATEGRTWRVDRIEGGALIIEPHHDEGPLEAAPHRTMHPASPPPEGASDEPQDA